MPDSKAQSATPEQPSKDTRSLLPKYRDAHSAEITCWLRGVFEGGGAKGIVYAGALQGVKECGCWFDAVTGSSAGAITAALVAAGYGPGELEEPTQTLLGLIQPPGFIRSILRLRSTGGILKHDAFRTELQKMLVRKSELFEEGIAGNVTFEHMFAATGIELYVVAADISRREPMVFHHRYTPQCQVADAVLASASIPFMFEGGLLTSEAFRLPRQPDAPPQSDRRVFRTIVDGGAWTNFPMFIFTDDTFNAYMESVLECPHEPGAKPDGPIVGFMLHELVDEQGGSADDERRRRSVREAYAGAQFEQRNPDEYRLSPVEQVNINGSGAQAVKLRNEASWKDGPNARRWPLPSREPYRSAAAIADKSLAFASTHIVALLALLGFIFAEWRLFLWIAEWTLPLGEIEAGFKVTLFLVQLLALGMLWVGSVLLNWALWLPARRLLFGVASTLIATPGTAPWEYKRGNVIALEIPPELTTLRVPSKSVLRLAKCLARKKTKQHLPKIIADYANGAGEREG